MECDRCGAPRPLSGPCPNCGAHPAGRSSLRDWQARSRQGQGGRGASGAGWGGRTQVPGQRGSGANWGDADDVAPGRSGSRFRRPGDEYQEIDVDRALVPDGGMLPANMAPGVPGMPDMPAEEIERLLGIRHPVYIPATGKKRRGRLSSWRVISGVLSVILACVASCGAGVILVPKVLPGVQFFKPQQAQSVDYSHVPVTPVATAGPAAKYVVRAVTAKGVDTSYNPISLTSRFLVGDTVYVVVQIRGVPSGSHVLSIRWLINGIDPQVPGELSHAIDRANENAYFQLQIMQPAVGTAYVYWDRPAGDHDTSVHDPALAQVIYFGVYEPNSPTATPARATPTGTKSPSPSPTKSKSGWIGGPPVAWKGEPAPG